MIERRLAIIIAGLTVFFVSAVLWNVFTPSTRRPRAAPVDSTSVVAVRADTAVAPARGPGRTAAVRGAFQRWQEAGVPVRFNLDADSTSAEVRFHWRLQFEIQRTGQTDLTWDQDGHLVSGVVTLATFDPAGRPLAVDDVRVVALHEIGHLIGLDHSSDSTDIMFAMTKVRDLSPKDIASALLLYQLPPGTLR